MKLYVAFIAQGVMIAAGIARALVAPATQPANAPVGRVLVLPFLSIGDSPYAWVGAAVQSSLVAELSRNAALQPTAGGAIATLDAPSAARVGRDAQASFVILGSFQVLDTQLRISGQVIASDSARVITGIQATGAIRDLFNLEDDLASQVRRQMAPSISFKRSSPRPTREEIALRPYQPRYFDGSALQQDILNPPARAGDLATQSAYRRYVYDNTYLYYYSGVGCYGGYYGGFGYWGGWGLNGGYNSSNSLAW